MVMTAEFIKLENIELNVECSDWEAAIKAGGELLVRNNYITRDYVNEMIESVKELGPYIVIAPHIALAHSRPSEHVLKNGLSMITLSKPVSFGNKSNDPVDIIFSFCAKTNKTHLESLTNLISIIDDNEILYKIRKSKNSKYVHELISGKGV